MTIISQISTYLICKFSLGVKDQHVRQPLSVPNLVPVDIFSNCLVLFFYTRLKPNKPCSGLSTCRIIIIHCCNNYKIKQQHVYILCCTSKRFQFKSYLTYILGFLKGCRRWFLKVVNPTLKRFSLHFLSNPIKRILQKDMCVPNKLCFLLLLWQTLIVFCHWVQGTQLRKKI